MANPTSFRMRLPEPTPSDTDPTEVVAAAACEHLLHFAIGAVKEWDAARKPTTDSDLILLSVFARATRTYEGAAVHLGRKGFAEQEAMLNRSLFEDFLDAHWVVLNPDLAVESLRGHDQWSKYVRRRIMDAFPDIAPTWSLPDPELTNDERARLQKLYGEWGDGHWTGLSSRQRLRAVLPYWPAEEDRHLVRFAFAWMHKLNNDTLHGSSFAVGQSAAPRTIAANRLEFRVGPTREWLQQAWTMSAWTFEMMLRLIVETFGLRVADELESVTIHVHDALRRLGA